MSLYFDGSSFLSLSGDVGKYNTSMTVEAWVYRTSSSTGLILGGQGDNATAVGNIAGENNQGQGAVAVGERAGENNQSQNDWFYIWWK
jgi:hypothetical protein